MSKKYAVLPCNGLDKCAGSVTREIALKLMNESGSEIICPVFYRVADAKYNKLVQENPLLVIDGCGTRCASKLAIEKELKIAERINISDLAKEEDIVLGEGLDIPVNARSLIEKTMTILLNPPKSLMYDQEENTSEEAGFFPRKLTYETFQKDKYIFRLPTDEGFYFNENDVWAYVSDGRARVGITDYAQKSLSDIMFFSPPKVGAGITQYDEIGEIESGKAAFGVLSPVSGIVTAINEALIKAPEMLNENPYEQGWIAEIKLTDFEEDKDLLHTFGGYMPIMKRKAEEFNG